MTPFQVKVYEIVRRIPPGRVLSYGAVAALAGRPRAARAVGAALSGLPEEEDVPWWRVVNHSGRITTPRIHHIATLQRSLLDEEGVLVNRTTVNMKRFAWQPDRAEMAELAQYSVGDALPSERSSG